MGPVELCPLLLAKHMKFGKNGAEAKLAAHGLLGEPAVVVDALDGLELREPGNGIFTESPGNDLT